jgi:hypothetical protein
LTTEEPASTAIIMLERSARTSGFTALFVIVLTVGSGGVWVREELLTFLCLVLSLSDVALRGGVRVVELRLNLRRWR